MNPSVSVIIPTFNRADIVERTIRAYAAQKWNGGSMELVVVDDGSTDDTPDILEKISREFRGLLHMHRQVNRGPAAARNVAIGMSKGEMILFAGDDVIPTSRLLEHHLDSHRRFPGDNIAVLGRITWAPELNVTPFMKWLETEGVQFGYDTIADSHNVSPEMFYGSNISLMRNFLMAGDLFDEDFTAACWEDTDLGTRLVSRGLRIIYNREALGYHFHPVDFQRYSMRAKRTGFFEGLYRTKNRKPITNPSPVTMMIKRVLGAVLRRCPVAGLRERGYRWSLQWFSWRGLNQYLKMGAERRGRG